MKFRTVAVVAFLALAALLGVASPAGTAAAAPVSDDPSTKAVSCSGTITYSRTHPSGLGELVIYYNSSNGGTNSACFYHRGAAYGHAAYTYVEIIRCTQRSGEGQACTPATNPDTDGGSFEYYAGPVGVTGTANYCVGAAGYIDWRGTRYILTSGRQGCPN